MNRTAGRRWLVNALAVLIVLLLLWSCAAFRLSSAAASALAFPIKLRSQISADYGPDRLGRPIRSLKFSIVEDTMRDVGLAPDEAEDAQQAFELAMSSPVPTATLAPGQLPPAITPTRTPLPTNTRSPSRTPTEMIPDTATTTPAITLSPTKSRTPTETAEPSDTPSGPSKTPTKTKTPTPCLSTPVAQFREPPEGSIYTYGMQVPGEVFAYDPDNISPTCAAIGVYPADNGAGISPVGKVEFKIEKIGGGVVYTVDQLGVKYCAFTGTATCLTLPVEPGNWPGTANPIESGDYKMKARAKDDEGSYSEWVYVTFHLDLTPPSPTPTVTPTQTVTPTATASPTPVCSVITLTGFSNDDNDVWWTVTNGGATSITMNMIDLSWPASNVKLRHVKWDGSVIASPFDTAPPTSITSLAVNLIPGQSKELRFEFDSNVQTTGYDLTVTFDGGCSVSDSQ